MANCWGFQHAQWHDSCIQKCVVSGKICAIILSITENIVVKICSESLGVNDEDMDHQNSVSKGHMERVLRFCVFLLDKVIVENGFSWEDTMVSFLYSFLNTVYSLILITSDIWLFTIFNHILQSLADVAMMLFFFNF